jgi:hypothetical protein
MMTIDELKSALSDYREKLKGKAGKVVTSSQNGPIGMQLIDAIVDALETLEKRVEKLEGAQEPGEKHSGEEKPQFKTGDEDAAAPDKVY